MKKFILLSLLFFLSHQFVAGQKTLTDTQKLATLGKVYGYLKYYHPTVAKGKFNWDQQLINQIPKVLKATNKETLSKVYQTWIEGLGEIKKCRKCKTQKVYFDKNFDLSWIQDSTYFSKELSSKLKYIEQNRNQGENYYVATEAVGNIKVTNEPVYQDLVFPEEDYRLLGLFKYWNIIEYFFPYKYLTDQNWNEVLLEMIPKIRSVSSKEEYQIILKELVAKLDDSHAWIVPSNLTKNKFLPIQVTHVEGKAVVSSYYNDSIAKLNNLRLGDIILKINGKDVEAELKKQLPLTPGSNKNFKIVRAYSKILHQPEEKVELTIQRANEILTFETLRYDMTEFNYLENVRSIKSKSISEDIGYINLSARFTFKEFEAIFKKFSSKKSVIIDLRGYPQGTYKMFNRFTNQERSVFVKKYDPDISYPGRFVFVEGAKTGGSKKTFKGKIILLVSDKTISLSEFTVMSFQASKNVITVGNQTAGADGRVIAIDYLGGYRTAFSSYGIMYPDGTESQRKGVKIDVRIRPTIQGLQEGKDEVLEKAIEIANQ